MHLLKKVIISGYYGYGNLGDESILSSMISRFRSEFPGIQITVVSADPQSTRRLHGVEAIDRSDFRSQSTAAMNSDLVILGGGGLFQDHHRVEAARLFSSPTSGIASYAVVPLLGRMHRRPVVYYCHGIGPLFTLESKTFTAFAASLADRIVVRDRQSLGLLHDIGADMGLASVGLDPAFDLKVSDDGRSILNDEGITPGRRFIAVSIRPWLSRLGSEGYGRSLAAVFQKVLDETDRDLLFLPFHRGGSDDDMMMMEEVVGRLSSRDRCSILQGSYHPSSLASVISQADLMVGMRYHSIVLSAVAGTPFVAISYDQKVRSVAEDLNMGEWCIDIESLNPDALFGLVISALDEQAAIRKRLESAIRALRPRSDAGILAVRHVMGEGIEIEESPESQSGSEEPAKSEEADDFRKQIRSLRLEEALLRQEATNQRSEIEASRMRLEELAVSIAALKGDGLEKDRAIADLTLTLKQRESSLSWRLSQAYGARFSPSSPLTRAMRAAFCRLVGSSEKANSQAMKGDLLQILDQHRGSKGIIIYPPTVEWNIPLFQRPQQMALALSALGYLFFYCSPPKGGDRVNGFVKLQQGCYHTDQFSLLCEEVPDPVVLISSTQLDLNIEAIMRLAEKSLIVYDYIDEIHEDITGPAGLEMMRQRHEWMIKHADINIATADRLHDEVRRKGREDVILIPNAADYSHFHGKGRAAEPPSPLSGIISSGRPVIGYYGALARWLDYELIRRSADERPNYHFVLIGPRYDDSADAAKLTQHRNVHLIPPVEYGVLPQYSAWFDVAIIPFVINDITAATSPIKIFEYMAQGLPIVTTGMHECRKYASVMAAVDHDDFIRKLDAALLRRNDRRYQDLLEKEASSNTWEARASALDVAIGQALENKAR